MSKKLIFSEAFALSILLAAVAIRRDPTLELSERDNANKGNLTKFFGEAYPKEYTKTDDLENISSVGVRILQEDTQRAKNLATGIIALHSEITGDAENVNVANNLNVLNEVYDGNKARIDELTTFGENIQKYKASRLFKKDLEKGIKALDAEIKRVTDEAKGEEEPAKTPAKTTTAAKTKEQGTLTPEDVAAQSKKATVNAAANAAKKSGETTKTESGETEVTQKVKSGEDVKADAVSSNIPANSPDPDQTKITSSVSTESGKQEDTTEHK